MRLLTLLIVLTISLCGCAMQTPRVEYIDRDCTKAADFAPAIWLPVRWTNIEINGTNFAATPDTEALLGNLMRLRIESAMTEKSAMTKEH